MLEFLQTYGTWILFGLFFLLMMRMHSAGGGCGMGHSHDQHDRQTDGRPRFTDPSQEPNADEGAISERERQKTEAGRHSAGCH